MAKLARLQGQSIEAYSPKTTKAPTNLLGFGNISWDNNLKGFGIDSITKRLDFSSAGDGRLFSDVDLEAPSAQ